MIKRRQNVQNSSESLEYESNRLQNVILTIKHRLRTRRVWRSLNLIEIIDSDIIESSTAAHFENLKRSYLGHLSTHSLTTWHSLITRF